MGHDHHFLSRLDRVASSEVELALSLYRDHALIREVLSHAKLPDGAERVAISLGDPEAGPFIVVARDGGFVTCLGRGMHTGSLPVITRAKLDAISLRVERLREGMQMAVSLTGGRFDRLFVRLYTAGPMLTREEAIALSAIQPLLSPQLLLLILDAAAEVHQARIALRKVGKPRGHDKKYLERGWGFLFAIGHFAVLLGEGGRERLDEIDPQDRWLRDDFLELLFQQCVFSISLRGVWVASKLGKTLLPAMKRKAADSRSFLGIISSVAALNAISHGHSRLRAEAQKALALPMLPETEPIAVHINRLRTAVRGMSEELSSISHEAGDIAVSVGRMVAFQWLNRASVGSPYRYEREEDVPDDIARAFIAWHLGATGQAKLELDLVLRLTPWVIKLRPEDFFLPAEIVQSLRIPELPMVAHEVIQRPLEANWLKVPRPARAPRAPGRNEPCKCGSGKKYKRCCAA